MIRGQWLCIHRGTPRFFLTFPQTGYQPGYQGPSQAPVEAPTFKGETPDFDMDENAPVTQPRPSAPPLDLFDKLPGYEEIVSAEGCSVPPPAYAVQAPAPENRPGIPAYVMPLLCDSAFFGGGRGGGLGSVFSSFLCVGPRRCGPKKRARRFYAKWESTVAGERARLGKVASRT